MTTFPKLTKPEMARLVEIGADPSARILDKPATTCALIEKMLVRSQELPFFPTRRRAVLTDLGREVLAGLPKAEGDRHG